jgi:hypothetical protein
MRFRLLKLFSHSILSLGLICTSQFTSAQTSGLLYDPEPPLDSAYVRVIAVSRSGLVDVVVDDQKRIQKLMPGDASDYMVLSAGKHAISIHAAGKSSALLSTTFDVVKGRAMTMAFPELKSGVVPIFFEDKANSNKLKALLSVYQLDAKAGAVDVLTGDGNTKVFTNVAYGTSVGIQVNPIAIELMTTAIGQKVAKAKVALSMTQGSAYSVVLLSGDGEKMVARTFLNKIERYTGK